MHPFPAAVSTIQHFNINTNKESNSSFFLNLDSSSSFFFLPRIFFVSSLIERFWLLFHDLTCYCDLCDVWSRNFVHNIHQNVFQNASQSSSTWKYWSVIIFSDSLFQESWVPVLSLNSSIKVEWNIPSLPVRFLIASSAIASRASSVKTSSLLSSVNMYLYWDTIEFLGCVKIVTNVSRSGQGWLSDTCSDFKNFQRTCAIQDPVFRSFWRILESRGQKLLCNTHF